MPMDVHAYVRRYADEMKAAISEPYLAEAVGRIAGLFEEARKANRTIYFFGNGGSASTASHFVVDISKVANPGSGRRFRCVGLSDCVPSMTAWANDSDYSVIFSEQLRGLAQPGDVAVGISGSGNSPNVLKAIELARSMGLKTVGLTGIGGGKLKGMVDVALVVPSNSMQHTEDVHLMVCHTLTAYFRDEVPAHPL